MQVAFPGSAKRQHVIDEDLRIFLESKPGWMVLTTLGTDGFPHSVPLGYVLLGDRLYLGVRDGTQKVRNIERDPRVSLVLATPRGGGPQRGVMIQGTAECIRNHEDVMKVRRAAGRLGGDPPAGMMYLRITPVRIRRWTLDRRGG